jgi:hypothetical protein
VIDILQQLIFQPIDDEDDRYAEEAMTMLSKRIRESQSHSHG